MMKMQMKRMVSLFLLCVLLVGLLTAEASAALRTEHVTMTENDTRTLYATEAEKSLGWISTNPTVVEVLTQGGNRCEIRAKSEGRAIVYCRYYKTEYVGGYRRFVQHGIDYEVTVNAGRKITVAFEPAGGHLNGAWQKEVSGTYGTLPTASRNGMTFLGWYTQPDGGSRIDSSSKVTSKQDHTLYAHWKVIPAATPAEEKPVTPPKPAGEESDTPTVSEKPQETPSGSSQGGLPEAAEDASQLIIFSAEGGFSEWYTAVTDRSGRLRSLPDAARLDCAFLGWYTAASGGNKVTTSTVFHATTTLYAHWTEPQTADSASSTGSTSYTRSTGARISNFHTITLDTMGGWTTYDQWNTNRYGALNYLPTPIRTGYTFLGWYTAPQGGEQVTTATVFYKDAVIYAHWV